VRGDQPPEIIEFERRTDPYANMLPGISSINAARAIGSGVEVGRRGNRFIMTVSVLLLLMIFIPGVLAVFVQVVR